MNPVQLYQIKSGTASMASGLPLPLSYMLMVMTHRSMHCEVMLRMTGTRDLKCKHYVM